MDALSLWQPWASLIAMEEKRVETRGRALRPGRTLAIQAAAKWDVDTNATCAAQPFRSVLAKYSTFGLCVLPVGSIVCVVDMVDCLPTQPGFTSVFEQYPTLDTPQERAFGNYGPGRFGYVLENVRPLRNPVPCKGRQFIWHLPPEVEAQVMKEIA